MLRIIVSVLLLNFLLVHDVLSAHRTSASRRKTLNTTAPRTSSMRNRMMEVLHLRDDKSLTTMFNMAEEDPAYVFVLPDKRNKTIVFHQRDFLSMDYPRISEVGRMEGPVFYKPLNATVFQDGNHSVPIAQRLTIKDSDELDLFPEDDGDEEELNSIVEENVRTESTFMAFMQDLNKKRPRAEKSGKSLRQQQPRPTKSAMRFRHFGDHFHPDLFHNTRPQDKLKEIIPPARPTTKFDRARASGEEEDDDEDEGDYRGRKVKQKPGYGNIGEVVSPPFHDDSADRSDEFISEFKIVPKLKSSSTKRRKTVKPTTATSKKQNIQSRRYSTPPAVGETYQREEAAYYTPYNHPPAYAPESRKVEPTGLDGGAWDDLGLEGWSGGLSDPVHEFEEKVEQPPPSDIFNEGISYNRMKEMFEKHIGYSYQQAAHPTPSEEHQPPDSYQPTPVRGQQYNKPIEDSSEWEAEAPSYSHTQLPATRPKLPYEESEEQPAAATTEEDEESYRYTRYQGQHHHYQEAVPESNEYIPPTYKKQRHPSHYDVTEEHLTSVEYADEEEQLAGESSDEEYVYMINGKPISLELAELLQNEHTPLNFTRHVKPAKSKWQITSSRSSHHDSDVFVARANNPFGHSTKWQWNNASASYVIQHSSSSKSKKTFKRGSRSKRAIPQLYSMVKCATGCDPLVYKGYGCYCGFLGQGEPLDGIDKCCKQHDNCYTHSGCPAYLEYFVPYLWKCYKGQPLCAVSHGEWGDANSCAARLCQCDLKLSMCLRKYYCPLKRNVCTASPWRLLQNFIKDF